MSENLSTIIGKDSLFTGTLQVKGTLRVDGKLKGKIISDETVSVGATGEVEADIEAKSVVVAGTVAGNIHTSEKLELQARAKVLGDLVTKSIVIEQGAVFHGSCNMKGQAPAVKELDTKSDKNLERQQQPK